MGVTCVVYDVPFFYIFLKEYSKNIYVYVILERNIIIYCDMQKNKRK
jgi:hypothetical protein